MSAPGPVKWEGETDDVVVLSSSSTNTDEPRQVEELGKRGSCSSESPGGDGYLQKKQRRGPADDLQLDGWSIEERDLNSQNEAQRNPNIEHAENSAPPVALPIFPQPSVEEPEAIPNTEESVPTRTNRSTGDQRASRKQFWKAGDYENRPASEAKPSVGIEHVRVHPKFLHANATSHRWALGAIVELVDNALDEVANGATFVNVDLSINPKTRSSMLVFEDDGGGMTPKTLRQCMSFGYSVKSKSAHTIGQYGNGFKTSTMRLGADVIVFSRSPAANGQPATQSIGMLSFTYLRETGHDDIMVPMIDYEVTEDGVWIKIRTASQRWANNLETIKTWSPYGCEEELFDQFEGMKDHGTKVVLFNLWEDDQGQLELDFETDPYDIQIRGANRDEKNIAMVRRFPNSRHCLTYRHSLRSYVSILYLRMPPGFKIILRGKEVRHHNLVDDLMYTQKHTYRPQNGTEHVTKESDMVAHVVLGFVKDAKDHVNIQGFNVYHKNRLIKPFWKIWNCTGSEGRGIIGVLEANFVEPSHDKQGFERTLAHSRLETRLLQMQKAYWINNCYKVGYVTKKNKEKCVPASRQHRENALNRGRRAAMSSPTSDPHAEARRSLPSSSLSEGPRGGEGPVWDVTAGTSRSGSLTNGTSGAVQTVDTGSKDGAPSRKLLEDLGRLFVKTVAGSEVSYPPNVQQHPQSSNGHGTSVVELEILKQLKDENNRIREKCRRLEEAGEQSLMLESARSRQLESRLHNLEQRRATFRRNLENCILERDTLHVALEGERQLRERDHQETVKKVKEAQEIVQELETENHLLQFTSY